MNDNPWLEVENSSSKRIDIDLDLFWAKGPDGQYMLLIESPIEYIPKISELKLSGFSSYIDNSREPAKLCLALNNNDDWEMFKQICMDIISIARVSTDEDKIPILIFNRLRKWQFFLSSEKSYTYPIQKQIGLFGELLFIKNTLSPLIGIDKALDAWVGPDMDKQDFRFSKINVEIKSYADKKRGHVTVSSIDQLNATNGDLFIKAYGLRDVEENGKTLNDIIAEIREKILEKDIGLLEGFDEQLCSYGFFPFVEYKNLLSFSETESAFYQVKNNFPRIPASLKHEAILSLQYELDLSKCNEFRIDEDSVLNEDLI